MTKIIMERVNQTDWFKQFTSSSFNILVQGGTVYIYSHEQKNSIEGKLQAHNKNYVIEKIEENMWSIYLVK